MNDAPKPTNSRAGKVDTTPAEGLETRLARLEQRVAELETQGLDTPETDVVRTDTAGADADTAGTAEAGAAGSHTSGGPERPDDDTFWALHGLIDHLGESGGVTYTGHIVPPGADAPVSWQVGLSSEGLSELDFAGAAPALAALGHPTRLELLQSIYEGTTTVAELGQDERFGTTGQIYHHVHALAGAGWLENSRRGHWRVPARRIIPLLTLVLIGTH